MEVVVSAAVLVLVVLGVLAAMDAVTSTAGANKARTVAATLAEKDQERLRGMRTLDIDQMDLSAYTLDVAGVEYTIQPDAQWVYDATGEDVNCGVDEDHGSYMRITSTVTSPITGEAVKPVVISSLVAPQVGAASQGTLTALVKNAAGQPVKGVVVTASPTGRQETTNTAGCAVFGALNAGTYTLELNTSGWVDQEGNQEASATGGVIAGKLTTVEFAYDRAASMTVQVKTKRTEEGGVDDPARTVLGAHVALEIGLRTFPPVVAGGRDIRTGINYPSGTGNTFTLSNLFPFAEGYAVYSGGCLQNDPSEHVPDYFTTYGGLVVLDPGETGQAVTVYEPPTNLVFDRDGPRSGITVWAYPQGDGCDEVRIAMGTTTSEGKVSFPGLPYGEFEICAEQTTGSGWNRRRYKAVEDISNTDPAGAASPTVLELENEGETCGTTEP